MTDRPGFPPDLEARFRDPVPLGEGGMGAVFRCVDRTSGREVAVKVLTARRDQAVIRRFLREGELLARIEHPGVLEVLDAGTVASGPYLVTELLRGQSLDRLPRPEDPLSLMLQVADALQAAHEAGLVHRDLKPGNIFLEDSGRVVLIDFGLALDDSKTRLTRTGSVVGTLGIMAPEILKGDEATARSDWYAWGASLFWLLERRPPFESSGLVAFAQQQTFPKLQLGRIPPESPEARVLRACLEQDPGKRPGNLDELTRLVTLARSGAFPVEGSSSVAITAPSGGRLPRGAKVRIGFVLVAGFLIGLAALRDPGSPPPNPAGGSSPGTPVSPTPGSPAPVREPDPGSGSLPKWLGPDLARGLRDELSEAVSWVVDSTGTVHRGEIPPEVGEIREFLDPDPTAWARIAAGLPLLDRFRSWVASGGRPELLPPDLVAELRELDGRYLEQGLESPLVPWIWVAPRREVFRYAGDPGDLPGLPPECDGWLGTAIEELVQGLLAFRALKDDYEAVRSSGRTESRILEIVPRSVMFGFNLNGALEAAFVDPERRRKVTAWLRPAERPLRRGLYAAMRAFREDPGRSEDALVWVFNAIGRLHSCFHAAFAFADLPVLAGPEPLDPSRAMLMARLLRTCNTIRRKIEHEDPALLSRELDLWEVASRDLDRGGTASVASAMWWMEGLGRVGRDAEGLGVYRRIEPHLHRFDEDNRKRLAVELFRTWKALGPQVLPDCARVEAMAREILGLEVEWDPREKKWFETLVADARGACPARPPSSTMAVQDGGRSGGGPAR